MLDCRKKTQKLGKLNHRFSSIDSAGMVKVLAKTPTDVNTRVPMVLGVNKAVIENVMFCHQEHSTWPFSDNATLKKIFDDLFDTKKNAKMVEIHRKISADLRQELNKRKYEVELALRDFNLKKEKVADLVSRKKELEQIKDSIYLLDVKLESFGKNWTSESKTKEDLLQEKGKLQFKLSEKRQHVQTQTGDMLHAKANRPRAEELRKLMTRRVLREEARVDPTDSNEKFLEQFMDVRKTGSPNYKLDEARQKAEDVD